MKKFGVFVVVALFSVLFLTGKSQECIQAETRFDYRNKLMSITADPVRVFYYDDVNGDGKKEAIGITSKQMDELGYVCAEVWYISDEKCVSFIDCGNWALYPDTIEFIKLKGTKMLSFNVGAGGSGSIKYVYVFDKSGPREVDNVKSGIRYLGNNKFIVYDSQFDARKDGTGHTWNKYYSKWDGKKLVEYGGIAISEAQVKKAKNGKKILKEIKKKGKIESIYYKKNNMIFINYTINDENYNVALKLKNGKLSYYAEDVVGKITLEMATNDGVIHKSITSCVKYPSKFLLD